MRRRGRLGALARLGVAVVGLLALLGVLAASVVAGFVGSDDTVVTTPTELGGDGRPVLTAPGLLAYDGVSVTLRASATGGVFIATAHPVDVADFVGDSPRVRLDDITPSGVSSDETGSGRPVAPDSADFWTHSMSGTGTEELTLDHGSAATQWVIAPLAGQGPTTVSFAVTFPGLFRAALLGLGASALVVWVCVELLLRSRPRPRARPHRRSGRPTAAERIADFVPAQPRPAGGARKLTRTTASVAILGVALAGCTLEDLVPTQREAAELATSKVALDQDDLPALFESYQARLGRATRAANPPAYRPDGWHVADAGPALASDLFGTRVGRLTGLGRRSVPTHRGLEAYSPRFESYPMWSLVASRAQGDARVDLFTRASVQDQWLRAAGSTVSAVPRAGRPSRAPAAASVADATQAWRNYLQSGDEDGGLELDPGSRKWRTTVADLGARAMFRKATVSVSTDDRATLRRVVSVADGELALVTVAVTTRLVGRPDLRVDWAPPYAKYRANHDGVLSFANLATGIIHLPEKGKPRLLGSTFSEVAVSR